MKHGSLESTAKALVADGKGILAADETVGTITKRFESLKISSTEESRRTYRQMLFTGPGVSEFLSGVIMYDETIRQKDSQGTPMPEVCTRLGIIPGIKVDTGAKDLAGSPGKKVLRDWMAFGTDYVTIIKGGPGSPNGGPLFGLLTASQVRRALW